MIQLVIDRTYDGYVTEIQTVYGQLQKILGVPIESAPDEWDRLFNVDFFIKINEKYIGLQIKPINSGIQLPKIFKEYAIQAETHTKFTEVFGGKVFYLFSTKVGEKKEIQNKEVIDDIKQEINRLFTWTAKTTPCFAFPADEASYSETRDRYPARMHSATFTYFIAGPL